MVRPAEAQRKRPVVVVAKLDRLFRSVAEFSASVAVRLRIDAGESVAFRIMARSNSAKTLAICAIARRRAEVRHTNGNSADRAGQGQSTLIGRRVERVRRRAIVERRVRQNHAVRNAHDVKPAVLAAKPDLEVRTQSLPYLLSKARERARWAA